MANAQPRERDGVRVSGEPGLNPLPPLRSTGWRMGPGTLTLTLSRREREHSEGEGALGTSLKGLRLSG